MNVEAVDLGEEIGVRVQLRLDLAPVVIGRPIPRERLNEGELHALRKVGDGFLLREPCRRDAPAQFGEFRFRHLEPKRTNRGLVICLLAVLLSSSSGIRGLDCLNAHGNLLSRCSLVAPQPMMENQGQCGACG